MELDEETSLVDTESNGSAFRPFSGALGHCARYFKKRMLIKENPRFNPNTPNKVVIYCVHGTADRAGSFEIAAQYFLNNLPDFISSVRLVSFNDRAKGLSNFDFAKQLKDQMLTNGDKNVILIGHSRGGVIISHLAEFLAGLCGINVLLAAPICAPFGGSYLAMGPITLMSKSIAEMKVDSAYLEMLAIQLKESKTNYIYVGADSDKVVSGRAFLPHHLNLDAENVLLLKRHGHLSALSEEQMHGFVLRNIWLLKAPEQAPGNLLVEQKSL